MYRVACCIILSTMIVGRLRAAEPATFDSIAKPFLKSHCLDCHGADTQEADVSFDKLTEVNADNFDLWQRVWEQVSIKEMPPKEEDQPDRLARYKFTQRVLVAMDRVKVNEGGYQKARWAEKGNHLDHELLFGDPIEGLDPPSTPARAWRIHPHAYMVRMNELLNTTPDFDPQRPFAMTSGDTPAIGTGRFDSGALNIAPGSDQVSHHGLRYLTLIYPTLSLTDAPGIKDFAAFNTIAGPEQSQLLQNAQVALKHMMLGPPLTEFRHQHLNGKWSTYQIFKGEYQVKPTPVKSLHDTDGPLSDEAIDHTITWLFENLVCRAPREKELTLYRENLKARVEGLGRTQGLMVGLLPIFLHTEALFNLELANEGEADDYGRVRLQGHELLIAINGALSYLPPDDKLKQALAKGRLDTKEGIHAEVMRMLDDPSFRKPRVLRFFQEYFDYGHATAVSKDDNARKQHGNGQRPEMYPMSVAKLVNNTDSLIELIVAEDKDVLKELLTTRRAVYGHDNQNLHGDRFRWWRQNDAHFYGAFHGDGKPLQPESDEPKKHLNNREKQALKIKLGLLDPGKKAAIRETDPNKYAVLGTTQSREGYSSIATWEPEGNRKIYELPADQRMGILTQPAWLIAHSDAMDNHVVHRGKWIRERLLGGAIAEVPVTVDAMLPEEPESTLRHRHRVTREQYCWKCHRKMDPLGFAFESYNHVGLYRWLEQGETVDASAEIIDSGDPQLDGKYDNALEMIEKLAASEHVHQVFVRHAFRYWMGRNETINDAPVLKDAYNAYVDNGGSMKALIASLLTSDAFLYRRRVPTQVQPTDLP